MECLVNILSRRGFRTKSLGFKCCYCETPASDDVCFESYPDFSFRKYICIKALDPFYCKRIIQQGFGKVFWWRRNKWKPRRNKGYNSVVFKIKFFWWCLPYYLLVRLLNKSPPKIEIGAKIIIANNCVQWLPFDFMSENIAKPAIIKAKI